MSEPTVRLRVSWDSGPYGTYSETSDPVCPKDSYGTVVVEIPADLWARYEAAADEMYDLQGQINAIAGIA